MNNAFKILFSSELIGSILTILISIVVFYLIKESTVEYIARKRKKADGKQKKRLTLLNLCVSVLKYIIFIIDIVTYLVSLLLITKVNYKEKVMSNTLSRGIIKTITSDIKYTLMTVWHSSYLLAFIVLMFVLNLAYGYIPQILPVFIANITESATLLGVLKSSMTIGKLLGWHW